jgi:hypothetical protein
VNEPCTDALCSFREQPRRDTIDLIRSSFVGFRRIDGGVGGTIDNKLRPYPTNKFGNRRALFKVENVAPRGNDIVPRELGQNRATDLT